MPTFIVIAAARTGGTFLTSLLRSHPSISMAGELLNDENEDLQQATTDKAKLLDYVSCKLHEMSSSQTTTHVGFRVTPQQLSFHGLRLDWVARYLGVTKIIVLWRRDVLETHVSLKIAKATECWYSESQPSSENIATTTVEPLELRDFYASSKQEWLSAVEHWPIETAPILVSYDDLTASKNFVTKEILRLLQCEVDGIELTSDMYRQNPASLDKKISNWSEINDKVDDIRFLDVADIVQCQIETRLGIPKEKLHLVPAREPPCNPTGWQYRVAEPFLPSQAKEKVIDALESGAVSSACHFVDEMARQLREIFDMPVAQPVCNGFTSLMLALQASNVGPGDEVICPSFTMIAVPNAVFFTGASLVFVDNSSKLDYNPSLANILRARSDKTKAVIVSHTYGTPMMEIEALAIKCKELGWVLIEDISESFGVRLKDSCGVDRLLGSFGDYGCASMYANKMVQAGDGGFIVAKDPSTASRLASLANHGFTKSYHFIHFEKSINAKINGLGAAMASGCLEHFDEILEHRSRITALYRRNLANLPIKIMPKCGVKDTAWVFGFVCESAPAKEELRSYLALRGIETRNFFLPIHLQPAYNGFAAATSDGFINSEHICNCGVYLPTHTNLTEVDVEIISLAVREFFTKDNPDKILCKRPNKVDETTINADLETLRITVKVFGDYLKIPLVDESDHILKKAVRLYAKCEQYLMHDRYDTGSLLLAEIDECIAISEKSGFQTVKTAFKPFIDYIQSQQSFEPSAEQPWILENDWINYEEIPTTTDIDTRRLLIWLVKKYNCRLIVELGSWLGHVTALLADTSSKLPSRDQAAPPQVYAVDKFEWQSWMECHVHILKTSAVNPVEVRRQGFLNAFKRFTSKFSELITPVVVAENSWENLEENLRHKKVDLIYLDFAKEASHVESVWHSLAKNLVSGKTIVVINALCPKLLPFISKYSAYLQPMAKPTALSKAFLYIDPNDSKKESLVEQPDQLVRKLNCVEMPGWTHHHQNAFEAAVQQLVKAYHDPSAPVLFIPAVEQYLADNWSNIDHKWIGIIHGVPDYPEEFHVPDLRRLCKVPEYLDCFETCLGLFTLTRTQNEFLRANLPSHIKIPIHCIALPGLPPLVSIAHQPIACRKYVSLIGEFARDVGVFFNAKLPERFQKVMLVNGSEMKQWAERAPSDIKLIPRLDGNDYEEFLSQTFVMLPLKYDGAANTIVVECINRNVPILLPKTQTTIEYLGECYPMFYDRGKADLDFSEELSLNRIASAVEYLQSIDKAKFTVKTFVQTVKLSGVLLSVPPPCESKRNLRFDVTIAICSYKRTHNLDRILHSLWSNQRFSGRIEIIVWNNNDARQGEVRKICDPYLRGQTCNRAIQLIQSSTNHYCIMRLSVAPLMRSSELLICDDDVEPGRDFISFFLEARKNHRRDLLCLRGHLFLPHVFNVEDPMSDTWYGRRYVKFIDDDQPEQLIHFAHMDACLISKEALLECNSHEISEPDFALVDDYWIGYVLNHFHGRTLRKLSVNQVGEFLDVVKRTNDSDTIGLALHTRQEVRDARVRFYIHHMLNGWPSWKSEDDITVPSLPSNDSNKVDKQAKWHRTPFVGFNVSSRLTDEDAKQLQAWGVVCVRIGSVGCKEEFKFEMSGFTYDVEKQILALRATADMLARYDIDVVITLVSRLASSKLWKTIAEKLSGCRNVIGYDLLNEPFTETETTHHWSQIRGSKTPSNKHKMELAELDGKLCKIISAIRQVDVDTPIILESSFWASLNAFHLRNWSSFLEKDRNIIISIHFYEPQMLTMRKKNRGRFSYPGDIPLFDSPYSETILWNFETINEMVSKLASWASDLGVKVIVGECGISRETTGAALYMSHVLAACKSHGLSAFVYAYRERLWDSMNYELTCPALNCNSTIKMYGQAKNVESNGCRIGDYQQSIMPNNDILKAILEYI